MPDFVSRWMTFDPQKSLEMPKSGTDKTDKSSPPPPSVSFVSPIVDHSPEFFSPYAPCPRCGASDWRDTPDGGRWCAPCVVAGRNPVAAVKVHSAVLDADVWVVANDLPRGQWPQDGAVVYTEAEVKVLLQVGPDTLRWVQWPKELLGAQVVTAGERPMPQEGPP